MDFQFVIPRTNADLLNSDANNYFVKKVYDAKELGNLLKDARNAFNLSDPFYVFDHFDTFFSIIENANSIPMQTMIRACDLMYVTIDKFGQKLSTYLQGTELTQQHSYLNLTKMAMFLIIGMVKCIDHHTTNADADVAAPKKSGKRQTTDLDYDWDSKRYNILIQIFNFASQLPLEKLWSESIAEEDFVNMICDIGYRTLEHSSVRDKRVSDTVFQIFGTAIKRYNHAMVFPVRILQILRTCEIAVIPIANGIGLLHEEYDIKTIFSRLLIDLIENLNASVADTLAAKNFSQFLMEMGQVAPKHIMPHLSNLGEELLNVESHVIRNSVLEIMGNVIISELSSEELSDELKEIRETFLNDLVDHLMDVSAHVRSKTLQIWNHLKNENSVPLAWQNKILQKASKRLDDKATLVRKYAVILIKSFLETNPFAAKLSINELENNLEKEIDKLQAIRDKMIDQEKQTMELERKWQEEIVTDLMLVVQEMLAQSSQGITNPSYNVENGVKQITEAISQKDYRNVVDLVKQAEMACGNHDTRLAFTYDQQCIYFGQLIKSYLFVNQPDFSEEFATQDQTVKFLKDSIEFSKIIANAVPKIENMLMSKVNTDVFEAVDFFTCAYLFHIKGTETGMKKMLFLVWSGDKEKRDAIIKAYHRILFGTDQTGRAHAMKVVDNLCNFFDGITVGHFAAMEVLMQEWMQNNDVDSQIIQVMFERFTMKLPDTTISNSRRALQLLCMAAAGKQSIAAANIDIVQSICFGERGRADPRIYVLCLDLLTNLAPTADSESTKYYKRYESNHPLIENTVGYFQKIFFVPKLQNFDDIAAKTFNFIYRLCQSPDIQCQNIIIDLWHKLKEISDARLATAAAAPASQNDVNIGAVNLPEILLARIIFIYGYCAMKEMIFLDLDVYNNMRYRQELMEEKKKTKKNNKKKSMSVSTVNMSASSALKRLSGSAAEPQQEPDEMLVGATAEDSIAELVNFVCEHELLYSPSGIFPKVIPMLTEILKHPGKYRSNLLQQSACLTLIRFMTVSSKFCQRNIQFLMGILGATKNIIMKCNIVIGLSDLTFRFPNIIEPWTHHFYGTLHEENRELRLTAVKMISHLILHEMIRVKGQISDLALCIVDADDEIQNTTKQFFKEIAHKSNILYNVLPDIISRLSSTTITLEEEKYRTIMKYIMGLINKDRQVESLIEKLCLRFRMSNDERQWRDIAYCLSLLSYTEKSMKKLIDNIQCFKEKVQNDEVYECFKTIISNTSKLAKPELKAVIQDFEAKLQNCFNFQQNDDDTVVTQGNSSLIEMPPPKRIPKRGKKVPPKKKPAARKDYSDESGSDNENDDRETNSKKGSNTTVQQRSARRKVTTKIIESSSSSSSDDEVVTSTKNSRNKRAKT